MSQINFSVVDVATGEPLAGATVAINGKAQTQTDSAGAATINAETVDTVTVTYTGYDAFSLMAGQLEDDGQVQLAVHNSALPAAIVTATAAKKSDSSLIGLLLIAGLAFATSSKKRALSGRSKIDTTTVIIGAAVLGGVYLMTKKPATPPVVYAQPPGYPATSTGGNVQPWIDTAANLLSKIFGQSGGGGSTAPTDYSAV